MWTGEEEGVGANILTTLISVSPLTILADAALQKIKEKKDDSDSDFSPSENNEYYCRKNQFDNTRSRRDLFWQVKFKRNIDACSEHKRKHQKCGLDCPNRDGVNLLLNSLVLDAEEDRYAKKLKAQQKPRRTRKRSNGEVTGVRKPHQTHRRGPQRNADHFIIQY